MANRIFRSTRTNSSKINLIYRYMLLEGKEKSYNLPDLRDLEVKYHPELGKVKTKNQIYYCISSELGRWSRPGSGLDDGVVVKVGVGRYQQGVTFS